MDAQEKKVRAAEQALDYIEPGMVVGLGTGSTAAEFVTLLAGRVREGLDIVGVPTSEATARQARNLGITLVTLDERPCVDVTVDGADELDDRLQLIKGGGGALLREKITAAASRRLVIIADDSKHVATLGVFALPVEVVPFGLAATISMIEAVVREKSGDAKLTLREGAGGGVFTTDSGHFIVDCALGAIDDPADLGGRLLAIPGVVEHGLFIDLADVAIIAGDEGLMVVSREDADGVDVVDADTGRLQA